MAKSTDSQSSSTSHARLHGVLEINRLFATVLLGAVVVLVFWTAYLATTLPTRFSAHNWNVTWVGLDSSLMFVMVVTAWVAWRRRQILAATAVVLATMLLCDAWFDMNTAWGTSGFALTVLTASLGNVPMAFVFFWLARRIMLRTAAIVARAEGRAEAPHRAHDVTFPFRVSWHDAFPSRGHARDELPVDEG